MPRSNPDLRQAAYPGVIVEAAVPLLSAGHRAALSIVGAHVEQDGIKGDPDYAASSAGLEVAQTRNIEAFAEG
jgi:hypothetical protein